MNLKATKTEEIIVDASELQEQINNLSLKINNNSLETRFDDTKLTSRVDILESKLENYIKFDTSTDSNFNESIGSLQKEITALKDQLANYKPEANIEVTKPANKFEFVLEKDSQGFADESWEKIIKEGQRIQFEYWKKAEEKWGKIYKMFPGWHGSAMSPVIKILAEEPEYYFKSTARLPGRFQLSSTRRWASILRFYATGDKVLKDDIRYATQTNAPIGLYVEGKTRVGEMLIKPFEQTIDNVILCSMQKNIPIYLSQNQDRLNINNVKILSHGGANIGIKHGPALSKDNYPFDAIQDTTGDQVWLTDPRFQDLQLEGPHNNQRPQAAMVLCGANIIISNLNMYGWMQGPYLHGTKNALVNGITIHNGLTSDGRRFCADDEIITLTISKQDDNDIVTGVAGGFKVWVLPKRGRVPSKGGWHNAGEVIL